MELEKWAALDWSFKKPAWVKQYMQKFYYFLFKFDSDFLQWKKFYDEFAWIFVSPMKSLQKCYRKTTLQAFEWQKVFSEGCKVIENLCQASGPFNSVNDKNIGKAKESVL